MPDFIVLGLPRSGTTWISNWLTDGAAVCLHDPFAQWLPEDIEAMRRDTHRDGRKLGIACTGAYLMPEWLQAQTCPVAVIERDPAACAASLERIGLPATLAPERLREVRGRRWRFDDLWNESEARALRAFLLPDTAFDAARYRLLRGMRIEPRAYDLNPSVFAELRRRGLFDHEETP